MGDTAAMSSSQAKGLMDASMATSAVSSVVGTVEEVGAIKAQGTYETSIANANAAMAKLKATQVLEAGDITASRKNLETQAEVGAARVSSSGVDVNKGSPAMLQSGIRTVGAMDEATIRNNAARQAWGYQTQAIQDTYGGQFAALRAKALTTQTFATGGLKAIAGPLGMYSQSALWQYRYGGRGTPGQPFTTAGGADAGEEFWDNG